MYISKHCFICNQTLPSLLSLPDHPGHSISNQLGLLVPQWRWSAQRPGRHQPPVDHWHYGLPGVCTQQLCGCKYVRIHYIYMQWDMSDETREIWPKHINLTIYLTDSTKSYDMKDHLCWVTTQSSGSLYTGFTAFRLYTYNLNFYNRIPPCIS